jgi:hypothetical protein
LALETHSFEVMLTIRACEQRGIKTTLVSYEYGGKDGVDSPLLYYVPEANAVVSTGSRDRWIELPEAEKIVGPYDQIQGLDLSRGTIQSGHCGIDARCPRYDHWRCRYLGQWRGQMRSILMRR